MSPLGAVDSSTHQTLMASLQVGRLETVVALRQIGTSVPATPGWRCGRCDLPLATCNLPSTCLAGSAETAKEISSSRSLPLAQNLASNITLPSTVDPLLPSPRIGKQEGKKKGNEKRKEEEKRREEMKEEKGREIYRKKMDKEKQMSSGLRNCPASFSQRPPIRSTLSADDDQARGFGFGFGFSFGFGFGSGFLSANSTHS